MLKKLLEWDSDALIYLNNLGTEKYDFFWSTVTKINIWIPLFIIFIYLFLTKFPKKIALFKMVTVLFLVAFIMTVTNLTKEIVGRLRPNNEEAINSLLRIVHNPDGFSFFSGHASSSVAITTLVFLFLRTKFKWSWLFYTWPLFYASSRVYLSVHYPGDIIIGACIGVLSAFLFYKFYNYLITPYLQKYHL